MIMIIMILIIVSLKKHLFHVVTHDASHLLHLLCNCDDDDDGDDYDDDDDMMMMIKCVWFGEVNG